MEVLEADYLHLDRLDPRTLILANPPYLRHQDIPKADKKILRARASVVMGMQLDANSSQYVYFLILSHRWLANNGVAAWLIPSGFMRSDYGKVVRHYLTRVVKVVRVHQFGPNDPQFENAKVLPAVVIFRKVSPSSAATVTFSVGGSLAKPEVSRSVAIEKLRGGEKWPIGGVGDECSEPVERIGDLFTVRRGIATGANDFFVLRREAAKDKGLPVSALRPVLPKSRTLKSDVIERAEDGYPCVDQQLCVIDCGLPESEIESRYPELATYLGRAERLGIRSRSIVRGRRPWYRQEPRLPAPFLCTYMGRGTTGRTPLRFIWNKSDAIVTNSYLMLYPKEMLAGVLVERRDAHKQVFAALKRAASTTIYRQSRMYAGGLRKIEPGELLVACTQ